MTPEQFSKLPKWAQSHIQDLERQRDVAIRTLNDFQDKDTPSPFYYEDHPCTGEERGPTVKRCYVQAHTISVNWKGVSLAVSANDYGQSGEGIRLQWDAGGRSMHEVAFVPSSFQSARLVAKEFMR